MIRSFVSVQKKKKILMAPGTAFYGPGWVRVSYCVPADVAKRSVPAFKKIIMTNTRNKGER